VFCPIAAHNNAFFINKRNSHIHKIYTKTFLGILNNYDSRHNVSCRDHQLDSAAGQFLSGADGRGPEHNKMVLYCKMTARRPNRYLTKTKMSNLDYIWEHCPVKGAFFLWHVKMGVVTLRGLSKSHGAYCKSMDVDHSGC
jgi:hypothetical protein